MPAASPLPPPLARLPVSLRIACGFLPWVLHGVLNGFGLPLAAVSVGLAVALLLIPARLGRHLHWRRVKLFEAVAVAFFAGLLLYGVAGFPWPDGVTLVVLVQAVLALVAWGSLAAGTPFTLQYARDDWPECYWSDPRFYAVNARITAVWGALFTAAAAAAALAWVVPAYTPLLAGLTPNALMILGAVVSAILPEAQVRRTLTALLRAQDPYPWTPPRLPAPRPADEYDVAVVGAGIGGLTAAALLAQRGLKVLVAEQHALAGGFCTSWARTVVCHGQPRRFVFDSGVHDISGLGPRGAVRQVLARLGLEQQVGWHRMRQEYHGADGLRLAIPEDGAAYLSALQTLFPEERDGLAGFFAGMETIYRELYADIETTGGVPCAPRTLEGLRAWPARHPHAFAWKDRPFAEMLDHHLRSPKLKEILSALTGYLSDDPRALTVARMAPLFGYYFDGGFYPAGGSQALADALAGAVIARGGRILLRQPVRRILVEGGAAVGIELADGRRHRAAAVISNADLRRTCRELVGREHLPADFAARIEALRPSASAFMVCLALDNLPDVAPLVIRRGTGGRDLLLATPSRVDPTLAPPGCAGMVLLTLVPAGDAATWDRQAPDYAARKEAFADELLAEAERSVPGLSAHILQRVTASPRTFERYAWTDNGAIYGPALGSDQAGSGQTAVKSPVRNLLFCGAGAWPGAGIEAVMISGTLAADTLLGAPVAASG